VEKSWFASAARERRIPFRKLGRYVRFSFQEVMECEAVRRFPKRNCHARQLPFQIEKAICLRNTVLPMCPKGQWVSRSSADRVTSLFPCPDARRLRAITVTA